MGKKSSDNVDALQAPVEASNVVTQPALDLLARQSSGLATGGFLDPSNPDVGFLNPLVTPNNALVQAQLGLASRDVIEFQERARQTTLNDLEANNQLTSSVTGNRLSDLNEAFSSDISDIATNFYIADIERAFSNTASLFELGLNQTGNVGALGLQDEAQRNSFRLQNFNNQLALAQLKDQNANSGGGFGGALKGALGGGISGLVASGGNPIGGLAGAGLGGAAGFFGDEASGGQILGGGFQLGGASLGNRGGFQSTNVFGRDSGSTNSSSILEEVLFSARNSGFGQVSQFA